MTKSRNVLEESYNVHISNLYPLCPLEDRSEFSIPFSVTNKCTKTEKFHHSFTKRISLLPPATLLCNFYITHTSTAKHNRQAYISELQVFSFLMWSMHIIKIRQFFKHQVGLFCAATTETFTVFLLNKRLLCDHKPHMILVIPSKHNFVNLKPHLLQQLT